MAANSGTACLRVLRRQGLSNISRTSPSAIIQRRTFSHTCTAAIELPGPNTPSTSLPPVTPTVAQTSSTTASPSNPTSPSKKPSSSKSNTPKPPSSSAAALKAASSLAKYAGRSTSTYTAYGATESLFLLCNGQASYSIPPLTDTSFSPDGEMPKTAAGEDLGVSDGSVWHDALGLPPTFSTWSQITMLHMYMLSARFRALAKANAPIYQQHLLDHFFYAAEDRMSVQHGMHARGTRNRYLKDLFIQWRGLLAAYDEGAVKGDAVLAGAVWRNVWKAGEDVDARKLAAVVAYMRKGLAALDQLADEDVMMGRVGFGDVSEEMPGVERRSRLMDLPFEVKGGKGPVVNKPVEARR